MVELKEKTVEELRKMASRKKIEGRSKMNKAQLVRALQKCKTTTEKRKIKGGALSPEDLENLTTRNYTENPLYLYDITPIEIKKGWIKRAYRGGILANHPQGIVILVLHNTYETTIRSNTGPHIELAHDRDLIIRPGNYSFVTHNNINYLVGNNRQPNQPIQHIHLPIPPQV